MSADPNANAPCPTCNGERYDVAYRGAPAEDGGPDPCPTCNGSGTTERRKDFGELFREETRRARH